MQATIHSQSFSLTNAIQNYLQHKIFVALRQFEDQISLTEVFIKDINGANKGGEDLKVLIRIQLKGMAPVIVEHTSGDLYVAINVAARRSKRVVKKVLRRHHRIERQNLRQLQMDESSGAIAM